MSETFNIELLDAIARNAENEAAEIISKAEAYAAEKRENAEAAAEEIAAVSAKNTAEKVRDLQLKSDTAARMERNRRLLAARRAAINRVYELLSDGLKKLDGKDFTSLVASAVEKYGENGQKIILSASSPADEKEIAALPAVKAKGMTVAKSDKLKDGFVLSGDAYDRDFSYSAIVDAYRERTEKEIADAMFGEDR